VVSPGPAGSRDATGGESAFTTYLPAIRAHWVLVVALTLAALAGSVAAISLFERKYQATAQILIAPLHITDERFVGLELLRDTGDTARTAQTAARLVDSPRAADLTAKQLGPDWTGKRVQGAVRVEPRGQSNVLAVIAKASSAALAARIANEYTDMALDVREKLVKDQLRRAIDRLRSRLEVERAAGSGAGEQDLVERLTALEAALAADGDPTLSLAQSAPRPDGPVGTPPWRILLMALLGGLVLGALGAVVVDSLDRRVRDEEELARGYPLPTLAVVPRIPRLARRPASLLPPGALTAFHTVRAQLQRLGTQRTILVTSASSGDGRTTTAANLALAMAEAGQRVLLMDLDLRNPELAGAVGVGSERGLGSSLDGDVSLMDLVVESPEAPGLLVLPAAKGDRTHLEALTRRLPDLLSEALDGLADYVIVDTPPLGEVSDGLRLAAQVDDVVVVARLRQTERARLGAMRELLDRAEITPRGMVVIGPAAWSDPPPQSAQTPGPRAARVARTVAP
jgi:Mrp family chromosome partitioning ATPase